MEMAAFTASVTIQEEGAPKDEGSDGLVSDFEPGLEEMVIRGNGGL